MQTQKFKTRNGVILKKEFIRLVKKGWKGKGKIDEDYSNKKNLQKSDSFCAIGAAAYAAGYSDANKFEEDYLASNDWLLGLTDKVIGASDAAPTKAEAIRNIEAIRWS
jgi:hypothetical protein